MLQFVYAELKEQRYLDIIFFELYVCNKYFLNQWFSIISIILLYVVTFFTQNAYVLWLTLLMYTLMRQLQFLKIQLPFLVITYRLRTTDINRKITVVQLTLYKSDWLSHRFKISSNN